LLKSGFWQQLRNYQQKLPWQKKKKNIQAIFVLLDDELGIQIFVSGFYY